MCKELNFQLSSFQYQPFTHCISDPPRYWTVTESYFPGDVTRHLTPQYRPQTGVYSDQARLNAPYVSNNALASTQFVTTSTSSHYMYQVEIRRPMMIVEDPNEMLAEVEREFKLELMDTVLAAVTSTAASEDALDVHSPTPALYSRPATVQAVKHSTADHATIDPPDRTTDQSSSTLDDAAQVAPVSQLSRGASPEVIPPAASIEMAEQSTASRTDELNVDDVAPALLNNAVQADDATVDDVPADDDVAPQAAPRPKSQLSNVITLDPISESSPAITAATSADVSLQNTKYLFDRLIALDSVPEGRPSSSSTISAGDALPRALNTPTAQLSRTSTLRQLAVSRSLSTQSLLPSRLSALMCLPANTASSELLLYITAMPYDESMKHVDAQNVIINAEYDQLVAKAAQEEQERQQQQRRHRGPKALSHPVKSVNDSPRSRPSFGAKEPLPAIRTDVSQPASPPLLTSPTQPQPPADASNSESSSTSTLAAPLTPRPPSSVATAQKLTKMYDVVVTAMQTNRESEQEPGPTDVNSQRARAMQSLVREIPSTDATVAKELPAVIDELKELIRKGTDGDVLMSVPIFQLGALQRYDGKLGEALESLNASIQLAEHNFDAYWQRALLYLAYGDTDKALKDLHTLTSNVKWHHAYRARADVLFHLKQYDDAIYHYQSALLIRSDDIMAYYRRALCRQAMGELMLAVQDFENVLRVDRFNVDALRQLGHHYFNAKRYERCIRCFDDVASILPRDVEVYLYKARCHEAMGNLNEATYFYCQAIHLDPGNYIVFQRRGMLLRNVHPKRAIVDLSLSLLLNDTFENILAYMHRGLAYTNQRMFTQAISDFQAVIRHESAHRSKSRGPHTWSAVAACQIGLIHLREHKDPATAVRSFTRSLQSDPMYMRAIICRAQSFYRLHHVSEQATGYLQKAIRDYSRAIHLRPDMSELHVQRGRLLLEAGDSLCIVVFFCVCVDLSVFVSIVSECKISTHACLLQLRPRRSTSRRQ